MVRTQYRPPARKAPLACGYAGTSSEQRGQQAPIIRMAFRRYDGREQSYDDDFLRLSIDDAEDLIAALSHLVKVTEQG